MFKNFFLQPYPDRLWLPIYTKPLHENRLYQFLTDRGIPCYLPRLKHLHYKTVRRNGKSYQYLQESMRPMFKGYVFACMSKSDQEIAWTSKSMVRIFPESQVDQTQFLEELDLIRRFELAAETQDVEVLPTMTPGTRVTIASGPWEGITGTITKKEKKHSLAVNLEIMQQVVATTIDLKNTKVVELS